MVPEMGEDLLTGDTPRLNHHCPVPKKRVQSRMPRQPLWQLRDAYAGRRAPALDETGYTLLHSDEEIFHMTKEGAFPAMPPVADSFIPAFKDALNGHQILAIVAIIKARWPIGLRILQAMRNPGFAGMPANANNRAWDLPPNCNAVLRRSEAAAAPSKSRQGAGN
jgi:hypothetical protein